MDGELIDTVTIAARFSGPAGTGNGGYVSGVAAAPLSGPAQATLRRPVPVETTLERRRTGDGVALVLDGEVLVEAVQVAVTAAPPPAVSPAEAEAASLRYPWRDEHAFPTCFTCGTDRAPGDGLRIYCGPVGDGRFAAPWVPDASLAGADGRVAPEFVWAALDCPTAIPAVTAVESGPAVLGRLALRADDRPLVGQPHVVVSRSLGHEGRKRFGEAALYTADGRLLAVSEATWIELRPDT